MFFRSARFSSWRVSGRPAAVAGISLLVIFTWTLPALAGLHTAPPSTQRVAAPDLALQFQGELCAYPLMAAFVLPGETLEIRAVSGAGDGDLAAQSEGGTLRRLTPDSWSWRAPETVGFHRITVTHCTSGKTICIKAFVLRPYHGESRVNGYRIGRYESKPLNDDTNYRRPRGLVEVTPENEDTWLTPHFQLKQFVCKEQGTYPKYLVLKTRLLLQLEMIQEDLTALDGAPPVLHVMSGYRTPYYNRSIGNRTSYSRHLYGDAADLYVDRNHDKVMDDLDGDGISDTDDAGIFYREVDALYDSPDYAAFLGGMGLYGPTRSRGPFIHVDTRGTHARWGDRRGERWLKAHGIMDAEGNVARRASAEPAGPAGGAGSGASVRTRR